MKLSRHPRLEKTLIMLAGLYGRLVYATASIRIHGPVPQGPVVIALWHQHICMVPALNRATGRPLLALMSASKDGQAIRALAAKFGIEGASGSSHKQALSGTRALLRAAKSGKNLLLTPDGPRGPIYTAKNGAVEVARMAGLPLVPCAGWCTRGKSLGSWDKCRLPYPFTTFYIVFGEVLQHPSAETLTAALNQLTAQARALAETQPRP